MSTSWEKMSKKLLLHPEGRAALKKYGIDVELIKNDKESADKPVVVILCPTYRAPEPQMQDSLAAMVRYTREKDDAMVYGGPPLSASVVHWSRNGLIKEHLKSGKPWTHVLFIDDDIVVEPDTLEKLLSHKKDIVAGLCTRRQDPPIPNIRVFEEETGDFRQIWEWPENQLIEVGAAGTGLMLISQHALEQVAQAYFDCLYEKEVYGLSGARLEELKAERVKKFDEEKDCYWFRFLPQIKRGSTEYGEDMSFCLMAKRYCDIPTYADTSVQPGHLGPYDFSIKDFKPFQKQCIARAKAEGKYNGEPVNVESVDWTSLLPKIRTEVALPSLECPNPQLWRCFDEMATEIEVLDFLYAAVRMLKPKTIIETGTYVGLGTLYMARAAKDNGFGHIHTSEIDEAIWNKARKLLSIAGFGDVVTTYGHSGKEMIDCLPAPIDFAFLDSNLDTRIGEMEALISKLSPSAVVAVHDTSTNHDKHGGPRTPFLQFAKQNGLQLIQFDTPRGLTLLRRPYQEKRRIVHDSQSSRPRIMPAHCDHAVDGARDSL